MLFRKWGCLVGPKNSIFRKLKSVDPKKKPLTTEMLLHFYFPFKAFPENERERERESVRERRRSSQFDDRRQTPSSSPRGSRELQSDDREDGASCSSSPRSRSTARSREGKIAIAPLIVISDHDRAVDRDLGSRSTARSSDWKHFRRWWFFFKGCGLCFLDFCFPSSFPNTRKYFPENFLKCNQTHGNIFLFQKLAFPENMYFPKNILQQPNTAHVCRVFQNFALFKN